MLIRTTKFHEIPLSGFRRDALTKQNRTDRLTDRLTDLRTDDRVKNIMLPRPRCVRYKNEECITICFYRYNTNSKRMCYPCICTSKPRRIKVFIVNFYTFLSSSPE